MSRVTACVLVLDGWTAAEETLASIRRIGLNAAVGLIGDGQGPEPDGVEVHSIEWRGDFGDARNQLAEKLSADWLLWLNDDEELVAFTEPRTDDPCAGVWIEDSADMTPRAAVRLQRRGGAHWTGALHETLAAKGGGELEIIDGIRLRGRGDRTRERLERHHAMATENPGGYGATLAEARHARESQPTGQDFMLWLRAYKEAAKTPDHAWCSAREWSRVCLWP